MESSFTLGVKLSDGANTVQERSCLGSIQAATTAIWTCQLIKAENSGVSHVSS